jgi:hypothetical protein
MTCAPTAPAIVTGILFLSVAVALPLQPAFGEGGARRDVVRHAAALAGAEAAGPASLTKHATILDTQGNVVRQGSNGWTCLPDNPATTGNDPVCMNEPWLTFKNALKNKTTPTNTQVGIAYMLQGDSPMSNTDPFAAAPRPGDEWIDVRGAHIMVQVPDRAALNNVSTDWKHGGPWVMWAGTPYAHLMIPIDGTSSY